MFVFWNGAWIPLAFKDCDVTTQFSGGDLALYSENNVGFTPITAPSVENTVTQTISLTSDQKLKRCVTSVLQTCGSLFIF